MIRFIILAVAALALGGCATTASFGPTKGKGVKAQASFAPVPLFGPAPPPAAVKKAKDASKAKVKKTAAPPA